MEIFHEFNLWHWIVVGAILLIAEVIVSGGFLLWIGLSAFLMGFIMWVMPTLSWGTQMILFGMMALAASILWWAYLRRYPIHTDLPTLNRRSEQYVGRTFILVDPIENSRGKIKVDGIMWTVAGIDMPAGTQVKVTSTDGVILVVEKIS
jgi:membrane protein implicated in regulation of membrane protease activity